MSTNEKSFITVVGAVNIDISATPKKSLKMADSNPGRMKVSFGGVGRNIAENMRRLGSNVEMITVFGDDFYGDELKRNMADLRIGTSLSLELRGVITSTYLCINNNDGDMAVAISDMDIYNQLTPEYLKTKMALINESKYLVIDANITKECIDYLCAEAKVPIIAEPVSTAKGIRFKDSLDKLFLFKPNRYELELLSGVTVDDEESLEMATEILLSKGVKHLVVSLGKDGVYYAFKDVRKHFDAMPCHVVNTTGCGDALLGGITAGIDAGLDMERAIELGLKAAALCAEDYSVVSSKLSEDLLEDSEGGLLK